MNFKKIFLATILVLIPAQSWAIGATAQAAVNKIRITDTYLIPLGCCAMLAIGLVAFDLCSQSKRGYWDGVSDQAMIESAKIFMQQVEERLEMQLKELREGSSEITSDLNSLYYVRNESLRCKFWSDSLEERGLLQFVQEIKKLESELTQLSNVIKVRVDQVFIEQLDEHLNSHLYKRSNQMRKNIYAI